MPYRQTIAEAYNAGVEEEYNRLVETPLREAEYQLIVELLEEYIEPGSTVVDIGSGPGRYAEFLLNRNCTVGVVDLSANSLKAFSDRLNGSLQQKNILFNEVSCATQLNWIEDKLADAVLLMGPLYHLIQPVHQAVALKQCSRILKPGGKLFTIFLSKFPFANPQHTGKESTMEHSVTHTMFKGYEVAQFRCWPCEAKEILEKNHFETLRIRNLEGIGSFIAPEKMDEYRDTVKKTSLIEQLRKTSEEEARLGYTHQFITVSRKNSPK